MKVFHCNFTLDKFFLSLNRCLEYIFFNDSNSDCNLSDSMYENSQYLPKNTHVIQEQPVINQDIREKTIRESNTTKHIIMRNLTQRNISNKKKETNIETNKYLNVHRNTISDEENEENEKNEDWGNLEKYNEVFEEDWQIV